MCADSAGLVLVVEDEASQQLIYRRWLENAGYEVEVFGDGESCIRALSHSMPDVICIDLHLPGISGLEMVEKIHHRHADVGLIMLTADSSVENAVQAIQAGAFNYLVKPMDQNRLVTEVRNAARQNRMNARLRELERAVEGNSPEGIIGESAAMRSVFRQVDRAGPTDVSILIHGESGTGKELIARALHSASGRRHSPFVAVNCAAIPESLQESELFGHEKGSFTGATGRRAGCFEEAHLGTLFLDEVAELSLQQQAKLLRVLQERTFRRVGGNQDIEVDFRLLAATHRDLGAAVREGSFREDLFFRIAVFELSVPPLRSRIDDIPALVAYFLGQESATHLTVSPPAMAALCAHSWPGNVRELQNAVRRAVVVADGEIDVGHLPPRLLDDLGALDPHSGVMPLNGEGYAPPPMPVDEGPQSLERIEQRAIEKCLRRHVGNLSAVARELQIGRTTLYRKLKKYGLE